MTPKERAEKSAEAMWSTDDASKWVGMQIDEMDDGKAVLSMSVEKHHTNGIGMCHGGLIFTLADSAFAFACNSHNQLAVAQHVNISFNAPAELGDRLTAVATEVNLAGKNGITDVDVTNQDGTLIAKFRGCSRIIRGQHFEE